MGFVETYKCNDCELEFGLTCATFKKPTCPLCLEHLDVEETTDSNKVLKERNEQYQKSFDYIDKALSAEIATRNHQDMKEFERGIMSGLHLSKRIVKEGKNSNQLL